MAGRTASEIKAAEMALRALKGEKAVAEMLGRPVSNNAAKTAANAAAAKRAAAAARLNQLYAESLSPPLSERAKALLVNIPEETRKQNTERLKKALLPVITRRKQTNEFGNSHKLQPLPTFRGVGRGIIGARRIQAAALPNLKNVGNNSRATALALKAEQNARAAIAARRAAKKVPFGGAIEEDPARQAAVGLTYNIMGRVMSKAKANDEAAAAAKKNRNEMARRVFLRRKGKGPTPLSLPAPRPARPTVNTTVLATTLTRAIKSALVKKPKGTAPPPALNSRALASTLTASIKKALGARKSTAGINTRGLVTSLGDALKKAVARQPAPKAPAPLNTAALAGALARAVAGALAKRQPAAPTPERKSNQKEAPERKSNQKPPPEVTPPPKINKNSLVKSLTNALKRAFAPSAAAPARQTGGEREGLGGRVFYRIGANGKPYLSLERTSPLSNFTRPAVAANYVNITNYKNQVKKSSIKNWERLFINKNDWKKWTNGKGNQKPPPLGALGTKGRQAAPAGVNGNKFQQRPGGAATTTTSVTGPTITGPTTTMTGPTVTGPTVTGPTVTVGAPNIKIQLNGLVKATEQARADPNKMANLTRAVANLKAKLSNGSEAKKALNVLFPAKVNMVPATVPTPAEVKKVMNNAVVKEVAKKQAATQTYKPKSPPAGKSVKNMSFSELLAMRRTAKNRTEINRYLRQDVDSELRKISRLSSAERGWRLGELYRSLPESLPARAVVLRAIQAEIRRVGRERDPVEAKRRLRDLYGNLGMGRSVPRELAREFKTQNMRAMTNYKRQEERYARRYGGSLREGREMYRAGRPQGEVALMTRAPIGRPSGSMQPELALRQGGARVLPSLKGPQIFAGPRPLAEGVSLKLPTGIPGPVLPSNQVAAINKAGGPTQALKVVAGVPGGAPAVARAAADLNEMGGNVKRAQELKGTPTAAIKAVQKLGGAKTASYALEGLNTLAQSKKTQVRKAKKTGRKVKKAPVRLHELNRVIEAVKRKKLVSLVSHNVANVNNNKKKKYYKKVIKSFILKKPLASKVQAAAKKNKS